MKLELNELEAQQLALLIDMAVKAQGVRVAEMAVALVKKLEAAAQAAPDAIQATE